jgi:hypothetical protein
MWTLCKHIGVSPVCHSVSSAIDYTDWAMSESNYSYLECYVFSRRHVVVATTSDAHSQVFTVQVSIVTLVFLT